MTNATQTANGNKTDVTNLIAQSCFLRLTLGVPGNSRKESGAGVIREDAELDPAFFTLQKKLFNCAEFDAIKRADFQMRGYIYNVCHPFDMGVSLLPVALVDTVDGKLEEYAERRAGMVDAFLSVYPSKVDAAAAHHGKTYNPAQFPSVVEMRGRFRYHWEIFTFSAPEQLSVMNTVLYSKAKAKLLESMEDAARDIKAIMRADLLELVSHLHEKLTPGDDGKPRILRDTAVNNLTEWLELFPKRNVTSDGDLSQITGELAAMLSGVSGDKLRNSDLFREQLRGKMDGIRSTLGEMVTTKAGRVFRADD